MIGLVSLFTDASSEMIYPLLPVFLAGLVPVGTASVYVGLMAGISETTASVLKIFSGRISDAMGKRKLLVVVGYGLSTVFRPLIAVTTAGWHVIAFRFADRVGKGIRTSPRDALISYSVGREFRGRAFGLHRPGHRSGDSFGLTGPRSVDTQRTGSKSTGDAGPAMAVRVGSDSGPGGNGCADL